jgi:hypothetical protein
LISATHKFQVWVYDTHQGPKDSGTTKDHQENIYTFFVVVNKMENKACMPGGPAYRKFRVAEK